MRRHTSRFGLWLLAIPGLCALAACWPMDDEPMEETAQAEPSAATMQDGEWRALFDGVSLAGWRGYRMDRAPAGWTVEDGVLAFIPGGEGGSLITEEQFDDFELSLEWKISEGGNSGIFFRVSETEASDYYTGPEMQVLDDDRHPDGANPETSAGANYALHAPSAEVVRPVGEWNEVRLVVDGPHVEHWLNGVKIVEYELWTDEWEAMVSASKFAEWPAYGRNRTGHLSLQDHGDHVWFRNIRIRPTRP